MTIKLNVYRSNGKWFCARWNGAEYDGCDELECDDNASADEAIKAAQSMSLALTGPRDVQVVASVD